MISFRREFQEHKVLKPSLASSAFCAYLCNNLIYIYIISSNCTTDQWLNAAYAEPLHFDAINLAFAAAIE